MHNGNATKMREALLRCDAIAQLPETRELQSIKDMRNIISVALAAPPRNCDIGTVEEQATRYIRFCRNYPKCTGCPCVGRMQYHQCEFVWAQLPCKDGGAK